MQLHGYGRFLEVSIVQVLDSSAPLGFHVFALFLNCHNGFGSKHSLSGAIGWCRGATRIKIFRRMECKSQIQDTVDGLIQIICFIISTPVTKVDAGGKARSSPQHRVYRFSSQYLEENTRQAECDGIAAGNDGLPRCVYGSGGPEKSLGGGTGMKQPMCMYVATRLMVPGSAPG